MASPAKRSGERIHYDLFSFDVLDRDGCKYCLVIIDEFSGFLFVYFLRKKSELESYLISFINMIEKHTTVLPSSVVRTPDFGLDKRVVRRVASVHADGAGENRKDSLRRFLSEKGIRCTFVAADNPVQNPIAENAVRRLVEGGEAIRIAANIPPAYWSDTIRAKAYIDNRLPKARKTKYKRGKFLTPIENWLGQKIEFKTLIKPLRRIGCQCWSVSPHYRRRNQKRTARRGVRCILLGYAEHQRGYIVQSLKSGEVFTSSHCYFDEHILVFEESDADSEWFITRPSDDAGRATGSFRLATGSFGSPAKDLKYDFEDETSIARDYDVESESDDSRDDDSHDSVSESTSESDSASSSYSDSDDVVILTDDEEKHTYEDTTIVVRRHDEEDENDHDSSSDDKASSCSDDK
jgi:hypothetical protein